MSQLTSPGAKVIRGIRSYVGTNAALLLTGAVGAAAFSLLISASADVYQAVAAGDGVSGLDRPTLDLAVAQRSPDVEWWMTAFTDLGGTPSMVFMTLTLTIAM